MIKKLILVLLMCGSCWSANDFTGDPNCWLAMDDEYVNQWIQKNQVISLGSVWTNFVFSDETITLTGYHTRGNAGYLWRDDGVDYWSGDWSVRCIINCTVQDHTTSLGIFLCFSNELGTLYDLYPNSKDIFTVRTYDSSGLIMGTYLYSGAAATGDISIALSYSTDYYVTCERDDDAGANNTGQYVTYICTTNYYGEAGASLVDTMTFDAPAAQQFDFRYFGTFSSYPDEPAFYTSKHLSQTQTGYQISGAAITPTFDVKWPGIGMGAVLQTLNTGAEPNNSIYRVGAYSIDNTATYAGIAYSNEELTANGVSFSGQEMSIAMWFRMKDVPSSTGNLMNLVSCREPLDGVGRSGPFYLHVNTSDNIEFMLRDDSDNHASIAHTLYADTWYHVGATYDDSDYSYRVRLYDTNDTTVYETTGNISTVIDNALFDLGIGMRGNVDSSFESYRKSFYGYIDEVAFFDDILTADEIDEIRNGTYGASTGPIEGNAFMTTYNPN